jgi:hypothetical protein
MIRLAHTLGPTTVLPPLSYEADRAYSKALLTGLKVAHGFIEDEFVQAFKLHEMQPEAKRRFVARFGRAEVAATLHGKILGATMEWTGSKAAKTPEEIATIANELAGAPTRIDPMIEVRP